MICCILHCFKCMYSTRPTCTWLGLQVIIPVPFFSTSCFLCSVAFCTFAECVNKLKKMLVGAALVGMSCKKWLTDLRATEVM